MLPESKDDFPKLLYLDQCHWINLARANYGHPMGHPIQDAFAAVRKAVDGGKLILPFSVAHDLDMMSDPYPDRRERLARFMVDLSRNRTLLPFWTVQSWEIKNALGQLFGQESRIPIRSGIVGEGLANAFGKQLRCAGPNPEVEAAVQQFAKSPSMTLKLLLAVGDNNELTRQYRADEAAFVAHLEQIRQRAVKSLTPEQQREIELSRFFCEGNSARMKMNGLQELGISVQGFMESFASVHDINRFVAGIPTLEASLDLVLASDRNLDRRIHQNDLRDLMWLSVALPYSNVIVSENYWGSMVRSLRLDQRYGTVLITDLRELPARLLNLGCL